MDMHTQVAEAINTLKVQAAPMAKQAIGKSFRVRKDAQTTISGVIVEAEVGPIRPRGRSMIASFILTLQTANGYKHKVTVGKLPR